MATIDVMTVSENGFMRFVTLSESETVSDLLADDLGFRNTPVAEHVLGKLGTDISNSKPQDLDSENCSELLRIIRQAVKKGEDESIPKPNMLAKKINEIELDLQDA